MERCRLCLKSGYSMLISISQRMEDQKSILDVVKMFVCFEVPENDAIPKLICSECYNAVIFIKEFLKMVKENDLKLKKEMMILADHKITSLDLDEHENVEYLDEDFLGFDDVNDNLKDENILPLVEVNLSEEVSTKDDTIKKERLIESLTNAILLLNINILTMREQQMIDQKNEKKEIVEDEKVAKPLKMKNITDFRCCKCDISFINRTVLLEHSKDHEEEFVYDPDKPYHCRVCFRNFAKDQQAKNHWRKNRVAKEVRPILRTEKMVLLHQSELEETHEKRCCGCKAKFKTNEELSEHSLMKHRPFRALTANPKKPCECNICYKKFGTKLILEYHKQIPYRIKKFNCNKCDKRFSAPQLLRYHMSNHPEEESYHCDICQKKLKNKANLKNHMNSIHLKKLTYVCPDCGKESRSKGNLQQHINVVHLQLRPYACSYCDKKFKTPMQMEVHVRSHTGVKPYSCSFCPKTFGHNSDWKRHEMVHTGNYPYSCRACDKKFIRRTHWQEHEKSHGIQ